MNQWNEFQRSTEVGFNRAMEKELYECKKCSFTYFELVHLHQYVKNAPVVPGQDPVPFAVEGFPTLKCGRCGIIKEHDVSVMNQTDRITKEYYKIMEDLAPIPEEPPIVQERAIPDEDTDKG